MKFELVCSFLLAAGLILNLAGQDNRMLALTSLVGASMYVSTPTYSAELFYVFCFSVDLAIGVAALLLRARASGVVSFICVLLCIAHVMAYILDGTPPLSPYRVIVKLLEFSLLAACVALSPVTAPYVRNRHAEATE